MKKLLSLPPNLVGCFHEITKHSPDEWFCCCDPSGTRLGSGGGTTWLLESCRRAEGPDGCRSLAEWAGKEKRILLHAGGQGRRVPAYAPSGKILTPIPVFRWERGQKRLPGTLEAVFMLISAISTEMALCVLWHSTAVCGRINLLKI